MRIDAHNDLHFAVPLCQIAPKLTYLAVDMGTMDSDMPASGEQFEKVLIPLDDPAELLEDLREDHSRWTARDKFTMAVARRIIIAAAKGGRLRHLEPDVSTTHPLAIRSLMPYWVRVESWGKYYEYQADWYQAAILLRPLLSHASLWLGPTTASGIRDRQLTAQDVQALHTHFKGKGASELPTLLKPSRVATETIQRYLPWLSEDAELARRVADAWNAVVECGEADKVKCQCKRCLTLE